MASDISRKTFNPNKHYSGVLMQQGRVQLDADWNEQLDIQQYRTHTEAVDVIGQSGVPKKYKGGNSFKITVPTPANDFLIAAGRMYVGGLLCELPQQASYLKQPYYPNPDTKEHFNAASGSPPASPPTAGLKDGTYIVYIDAWQREINYLDDPLIQEVALGGADTTTRLQTVWQVKLLKVPNPAPNTDLCKTDFNEWNELTTPPTGKLNVQAADVQDPKDPCELPPSAGYRRLENQLYRVEVQQGGNRAQATFKWSRDNASVETSIEKIEGDILTVAEVVKDEILGFANGQWVEIVDEESTLKGEPQQLVQVIKADAAKRTIKVNTTVIPNKDRKHLKLRRWDQNSSAINLSAAGSWIDLEDGIQVTFSGDTYRAGDYWLIPARTATGEVEWVSGAQPPVGIHHHYCKLAVVQVLRGKVTEQDCRPLFPALTEICAEDICFDNKNCAFPEVKTVQEALDELCKKRENACTFVVLPIPGWEEVFNKIDKGESAQICFQVGDYPLNAPLEILDKGNLKLVGIGPGTRILSTASETGLKFKNCASVIVRDLYIETGRTGSPLDNATESLNGCLTFNNCPQVTVEQVHLKCADDTFRNSTCITVLNEPAIPEAIARIRDNHLNVGHFQQGILLVNVLNAFVESNIIGTVIGKPTFSFLDPLKNKSYIANIRNNIISDVSLTSKRPTSKNIQLRFNDTSINFKSPVPVALWTPLWSQNPPKSATKSYKLLNHAIKLVNRLITDVAFGQEYSKFRGYIESIIKNEQSIGYQGITVGGELASDIKIQDNIITNMLQGIHVGLSKRDSGATLQAQRVSIRGNAINITLPVNARKVDRHGIFVGNCKNLSIENNQLKLKRLTDADDLVIDGIRVWGELGDRLMITQNQISEIDDNLKRSFDIGIRVHPVNTEKQPGQWIVMWNVAPSKHQTLILDGRVVAVSDSNIP